MQAIAGLVLLLHAAVGLDDLGPEGLVLRLELIDERILRKSQKYVFQYY